MDKNRLFLGRHKHNQEMLYISKNPAEFLPQTGFFSGIGATSVLGHEWAIPEYKDINTALTKSDYNRLRKFMDDICDIGYIESETDPKYNEALILYKDVKDVYDKLGESKNLELLEICNNAKRITDKNQYPLSEYDYELILDDKDPGEIMILKIFEDDYDLGRDYVEHTNTPEMIKNFIDYSLLGRKLIDEEYAEYIELEDCRIVKKKSI